jgi:DNA-binding NarL/FixJ family response regulator
VVVTDIFMPEKDGLELIRLLAREFPETPVVAMSGGAPTVPQDYLPHAALFGAMVTLAKPFRTDELVAAIDKAIGQGCVFPSFDEAAPGAADDRTGPPA